MPALIGTKDVRIAARGFMVEKGETSKNLDRLAETLGTVHNILGEPNEDRSDVVARPSRDPQTRASEREGQGGLLRGVRGFIFPTTKKIPQSVVQILDRAGVDFSVLGGKNGVAISSDRSGQ